MKNKHSYIIIFLTIATVFAGLFGMSSCSSERRTTADTDDADSTRTITLLFVGDMMQHIPQVHAAADGKGGYNYDACFENVKAEIESADVAIANLEVTLAGEPYSGYPQFSAPDGFAAGIRNAGFDVLLTCNNHCCDTGKEGLERTLKVLDSLGIAHLGSYRNEAERTKGYPYLVEKNGFRIVLLAYTYGTNGRSVPSPCVVNQIDTLQMATDIAKARQMKPDAVIAFMHWGIEYELTPNNEQKELADWLIGHGVDHVVGSHPHVVQPLEMRADHKGNKHLIAWSLGNYISNQPKPASTGGLMVKLTLQKDSTVRVADADYSLVWVSRPAFSGRRNYTLFYADVADSILNAAERNRCAEFKNSVKRIFPQTKGKVL